MSNRWALPVFFYAQVVAGCWLCWITLPVYRGKIWLRSLCSSPTLIFMFLGIFTPKICCSSWQQGGLLWILIGRSKFRVKMSELSQDEVSLQSAQEEWTMTKLSLNQFLLWMSDLVEQCIWLLNSILHLWTVWKRYTFNIWKQMYVKNRNFVSSKRMKPKGSLWCFCAKF